MKKIFRSIIDSLMLILYIIEMGEKYVGNAVHEWLGVALMIVFIIHNILNRKWYKTIFKGSFFINYSVVGTVLRVLHTLPQLIFKPLKRIILSYLL